jgi:Flp pilus assembly protein TadD
MSDPRAGGNLAQNTALHLILMLLLGFFAYSNTLKSPFQFDDPVYIEENILISDPSELLSPLSAASRLPDNNVKLTVLTRYLSHLTFAINYWLGGFEVRGYHATNLAIHLVNALLVYWFVLLSFRTPYLRNSGLYKSSGLIALFSALVFVAHPVQTQAVTYITQRFTSMCAMFYLLSLTLYIKARLSEGKKGHALYLLSFMSALMAMFTKEISFTLPLAIALYEFMFFEPGLKSRAKRLLPYFLIMPTVPLLVSATDFEMYSGRQLVDILTKATAEITQTEITSWEYFLTQLRIIPTYLRLLFLPINQNLDYNYPIYNTFLNVTVLISFVFLASIAGLGVVLLRRSARTDPSLRLVSFGIFWFFITLSVESSFIALVDVIYEHRLYLPGMAVFPAFAAGVYYTTKKFSSKKTLVTVAVCVAVVISLAIASHERNEVWKTKAGLWEDVVRKAPGKWRGYYNLGVAYDHMGRIDDAFRYYEKAIALKPDSPEPHVGLGVIYARRGMLDRAILHYKKAINLWPAYPKAYYNLGNAYFKKGLVDKAIESYMVAVEQNPTDAEAHFNLGTAYFKKGLLDRAIEHYLVAIQLRTDYLKAHDNLAVAYEQNGLQDKAAEHARIAEELRRRQ